MIVSRTNTLSRHRATREWSQQAFADNSGVSRTEISAIEMGRLVPSVAVALRLATALGESVEAVFWRAAAGAIGHLGLGAGRTRRARLVGVGQR